MKKIATFAFGLIGICAGMANAQNPETFEQAKALSAQQGKPLLLEFFRDE